MKCLPSSLAIVHCLGAFSTQSLAENLRTSTQYGPRTWEDVHPIAAFGELIGLTAYFEPINVGDTAQDSGGSRRVTRISGMRMAATAESGDLVQQSNSRRGRM